jgi:hypothetical protein
LSLSWNFLITFSVNYFFILFLLFIFIRAPFRIPDFNFKKTHLFLKQVYKEQAKGKVETCYLQALWMPHVKRM